MPWPTEVRVEPGRLTVRRDVDESGALVVPWDVEGTGRVMGTTATLIEQALPYQFRLELARGKVNQIRCQAADWQAGGLHLPAGLFDQIRNMSVALARPSPSLPRKAISTRRRPSHWDIARPRSW